MKKSVPIGRRNFKQFAILALCLSSAWAADYYVVPGGAGTRDGISWTNAAGDIQAAIDACASSGGGTVKIAAGTYKPTSQPNLLPAGNPAPSPAPPAQFNHFTLKNNVKVWGGYARGSENRNPQIYPTILSGDLSGNDKDLDGDGFIDTPTYTDNCRVFYHPPWMTIDSTAQLDGVTISGGCGRSNSYFQDGGDTYGGGMLNAANISPTISNCIFRDNTSEGDGGAFYKDGSYSNPLPIFNRCTFMTNKAGHDGGAAFFKGASGQVLNCTFVANAASQGGGAAYTSGGSISLMSCTVVNNRAGSIGGVYASGPVTNCILWGNAAASSSQQLSTSSQVSFSIVQGGYSGTGNLDKDPLLLPLTYYGGAGTSILPTMALRGDSPAINSGSPNAPSVDQRGYPRTPGFDIGAYEYRLNRVIYVKAGGTGDGTSWANASGDLASSLAGAPASSSQTTEIWVAEGTYTGTIALRSYVSVYGGFSGTETELSERDIAAHPTILSGDTEGNDADIDGDGIMEFTTVSDNAPFICSSSGVHPSAMLDGFVLSGANTAAIRNYGGTPTAVSGPLIANCTFRYNTGASMLNEAYSTPRILNCTFHHNAPNREVMVNSVNGAPVVANCTFSGSSAMGAAPIISNQTQSIAPKIFNCTFSVGAYQPAIINASGTQPTIRNCIIWGNRSTSGIQGGNPIVSYCVIQGNGGADPLLMPLGKYGGPTLTMPIFAYSAAIGHTPELGYGGVDAPYADQRGFTRDAKPDIGACEWQQNYAVIQTKDGTDRYAIGTRAILNVVSESYDVSQMPELQWQWYSGSSGDTGNPIGGVTQSRYATAPLTADSSYWVRILNGPPLTDAAITLKAYSPHVIHVSTTGNHANDGSSWGQAKPNLQSALENSKSGDHIWVASGTYTNPGPDPITLRSGVSVYGGFSGIETQLAGRNGTATILSADQLGNDVDYLGGGSPDSSTTQDNSQIIIEGDMIGSSSVLDGFVFSGATVVAVLNANGSSPVISNCTFRDNPGTSIQNANFSSPDIVNCTFGANSSNTPVPMIVMQTQSSPKITNCTFAVGSTQTAIRDAYGDSTPAILNSIFWGNTNSSALQLNNATVSHCVVQNGFSDGTDILTEDPKLMPIGMYGGVTPSMPVSAGSGAINQGLTGADVPYDDQRGFVRDSKPDIGACEWQRNFAVIRAGNETNRFAIGTSASLSVVSESMSPGTWQWYQGAIADMGNPVPGATHSHYLTAALTSDTLYWVQGWTDDGPIDVGITLKVYEPRVRYVSTTGDDTRDGSTWQLAKRSVQSALAASQTEGHVWVAAGTYAGTISLRNGVSVYGGFSGSEALLAERDIAAHPTIITADINRDDVDTNGDGVADSGTSENASYACANTNVDSSAVLDGFIFSGAKTSAIVNTVSSPTITNCTFRYNLGSAIHNLYTSAPQILNCTFHHNAPAKVVIQNFGSGSPSVLNCTFACNLLPATAHVIENQVGSLRVSNCTFALNPNQSAVYGGSGSSTAIANCIIWGNSLSPIAGGAFTVSSCVTAQNPNLLPLGNYGGPTPTMPVSAGSVAINQGIAGADVPLVDQRGYSRDAQPDVGACEWQQHGVAAIITEDGAERYAIGTQAELSAFSESASTGIAWQWYHGMAGDTRNPVSGATLSRLATPPLTAAGFYWVRGYTATTHFDGSIALPVFFPRVIRVSEAGSDTLDGSSWQTAKRTLHGALAAAHNGDHIWVEEGTYTGTISLSGGVSVYGGFSGVETRLDQRDIAANPTILSADINGNDADTDGDGALDPATTSDNAPNVCVATNIGPSSILNGFILSGATVYAIRNLSSSPSIANCVFRYNPGMCISNTSSSPEIRNSTFHHNAAGKVVLGNASSSPNIVNCTFDMNSSAAMAPTIANWQFDSVTSTPEISNCTFVVGASQSAISSSTGCYPTIRNCIIWGNTSQNGISGAWSSVAYCVIQGGFNNRESIVLLEPLLLPLGNYGGPTPTMPLGSGSSAINTGASGSDIPYADQRGFVRDALPDIGASEFGVAVAALAGDEPAAPGAIGSTPWVSAHTDKVNPTYQWFYGLKGDTSQPVPGGNSESLLVLGPLEAGVKVWARITPGDGSASIDTSERTFEVQATYDQWCDHHGLSGPDRATDATVAGDGVGNLLKFALGLRPRDRSAIADRSTTSYDIATAKLTQEWRLSKTPTGVTIVFEGSSDLKTWLPVTPVRTSEDAGFETWKASVDTISPAKAAYLRARITTQ